MEQKKSGKPFRGFTGLDTVITLKIVQPLLLTLSRNSLPTLKKGSFLG